MKHMVKRVIGPLVGVNGGFDPRGARFAGRLCNSNLSEQERSAIYNSLIFRNGVRKTTAHGRNAELIARLLDMGLLSLPAASSVLDVGASVGLDALTTYRLIKQKTDVRDFVLGDLFTEIGVGRAGTCVYDQDGVLIQFRWMGGFVNCFTSCVNAYERIAVWPQRALGMATQKLVRLDPGPKTVVALMHPAVSSEPGAPFSMRRIDVFEPIAPQSYDLIFCLHLLVDRYFSPTEIEGAVSNLKNALRVGGTLITGATEKVNVITRRSEDLFETVIVENGEITARLPR